ncbi:MAG: bifunctional tetrahydrofolate synthase/dihydrofolate synthase [Neptuniibacter sp.]
MTQLNTEKNLSEWLSWMEACHPSEIELGLDRIKTVAEKLAIDLSSSTVVTVAGTNGKGSTISYLQSIYLGAGYSVGTYTSPHFIEYNERVQLSGQNVSDQQLCDVFSRIDAARGEIPLTYFEFGTLAALVIFSDEKPDLVLLEVGLGGRLDAVNIIDADVALVTTVALDHTDWLGDNREDIGFEKAGIFRSGKPAICGDLNPPGSIAATAQKLNAQLLQSQKDFNFSADEQNWHWQGKTASGEDAEIAEIPLPKLPLPNAATAIQATRFISLAINDEQIKTGIGNARLTGRMQTIRSAGINFCLDVAHNPEAAEHLKQQLAAMPGQKWLVLGMLADKDCQSVISALEASFEKVYLVTLDNPRGLKATELQSYFSANADVITKPTVADALSEIKTLNNLPENVIIAGSFFTVADALSVLETDPA